MKPNARDVLAIVLVSLVAAFLVKACSDEGARVEADALAVTHRAEVLDGPTTSTAPPLTTTTTSIPAPLPKIRATPPKPSSSARADGSATVSATAYCLTGTMADGTPAHRGAVAANRWPLGTRLRVSSSPVGEIVTVEDRIGSGSDLDFALPGSCDEARSWGRRTITVEVLE